MRHVSFALVLIVFILSFGLANGAKITPVLVGGYGGSPGVPDSINVNTATHIDIYAQQESGDPDRLAWGAAFGFRGTGDVTNVTWNSIFTGTDADSIYWEAIAPDFILKWTFLKNMYKESWDGDLSTPDLYNYTGATLGGWMGSDLTNYITWRFSFTIPGDETTSGTFCIGRANAVDGGYYAFTEAKYDWLFEDPIPAFPDTCFVVARQADPPPVITNCPGAELSGDFDQHFEVDLDATDGEPITAGGIHFCEVVDGPGDIDDVTGVWSWDPTCADVGSHTIYLSAYDANNACPTDPQSARVCEFTVLVTNTTPVITGNCGVALGRGLNSVSAGIASFGVTDPDLGDVHTYSITVDSAGATASINGTGVVTFTSTDVERVYTMTVKVTDCNLDFDTCSFTVEVIGDPDFHFLIEKSEGENPAIPGALQGHHDYIDVSLMNGKQEMYGYDFLIGYDASALTFMGAEDKLDDSHNWEYFTYRYSWNGNCGNACPTGILRVVGMVEKNDGTVGGDAVVFAGVPIVLFTLDFLVSNNRLYECMYVPIYWYWMDCGDNTVAHYPFIAPLVDPQHLTRSTAFESQVYLYDGVEAHNYLGADYGGLRVDMLFDSYPSQYGTDDDCVQHGGWYPAFEDSTWDDMEQMWVYFMDSLPKPGPVEFIKFFGGGVDIVCRDDIDAPGDVNLNGVPNEIADAVTFTNYFIYNLAAFTINIEGQIAATEINGDGIALSVADLVYLIRIIVGDAQAYPKVAPNIKANVASGRIVNIDAEIGAAAFTFEGNASIELAEGAYGMELITNYDGVNTYALVYSLESGATASGNILNTSANLIKVEAADYNGNDITMKILPTSFALRQNYPNPFNPTTVVSAALPKAADYSLTIFNVAGQKVADFSGHSEAGVVTIEWDASQHASGIYFYNFKAGSFEDTKKMVLLK